MDQNGKDDLKTQFETREGTYRLMTLSEYSRPNRVGYQSNQNNPQVRVSLITLPANVTTAVPAVAAATATAATSVAATTTPPSQLQQPASTASATFVANGQDATPMQPFQLQQQQQHGSNDRICFNFGKELYVYAYRGVKKVNK